MATSVVVLRVAHLPSFAEIAAMLQHHSIGSFATVSAELIRAAACSVEHWAPVSVVSSLLLSLER